MSDSTPSTPAEERAATHSLGDLLGDVSRDISTLMRQEVELAKAELKASATKAGTGAGMMGGAGYAALMALLFLSIALWWALGTLVGGGWSGVIVAGLWAAIALVLFLLGRSQLRQAKGMPQTVETVKRLPETMKRNEENQ